MKQSNRTISISLEFQKRKREKGAEGVLEEIITEKTPDGGEEKRH